MPDQVGLFPSGLDHGCVGVTVTRHRGDDLGCRLGVGKDALAHVHVHAHTAERDHSRLGLNESNPNGSFPRALRK